MNDVNPDHGLAQNSEPMSPPPPPNPPVGEPPAPRPLHLRKPAIVLFAIGVLIAIGGIAKFIPGGIGTGGAVAFWGALLFGLSFIRLPKPAPDEPHFGNGGIPAFL